MSPPNEDTSHPLTLTRISYSGSCLLANMAVMCPDSRSLDNSRVHNIECSMAEEGTIKDHRSSNIEIPMVID
jgi:hypothetical protein